MRHGYFEVLPLKYLWMGGGSGSSGGGSGGGGTTTNTTNTKNEVLPWSGYVPGVTSSAYNRLIPELEAKAGTGLTPQEKAYYTGQGMNDLTKTLGATQKSLSGSLARSGVRGPAVSEVYSDLARSKVMGMSGMLSNLQGLDVSQKGANTDRLMKGISIPGSPVQIGGTSTGTTNYAPANRGGGGGS